MLGILRTQTVKRFKGRTIKHRAPIKDESLMKRGYMYIAHLWWVGGRPMRSPQLISPATKQAVQVVLTGSQWFPCWHDSSYIAVASALQCLDVCIAASASCALVAVASPMCTMIRLHP